jgi:hypothetical protein
MVTTSMIYTAAAPTLQFSGTFIHMVDIRFDDHELDRNRFTDEEVSDQSNLRSWRTEYIQGVVTTNIRTDSPKVFTWFHGVGNAYK